MSAFDQMPPPPQQQYQLARDAYGNPVQVYTIPPQQQYYQQPIYPSSYQPQQSIRVEPVKSEGLGLNFDHLVGTNVSVPVNPMPNIVPAEKKKRRTKRDKSGNPEEDLSSATQYVAVGSGGTDNNNEENIALVEGTRYEDTYADTTYMLKGAIAQIDELSGELKQEISKIRNSNTLKGKYTYLANLSSSVAGLINTKVSAIREINNSIKNANDSEYRRYKDIRIQDQQDDSKMIMDMYNAYIKTPVGSLPGVQYSQPNTLDITSGLNGIVRVDSQSSSAENARFGNFLSNLTPEQNYMINEGNPDLEEVMIYDQSTGKKYFQWINTRTGQEVPNMPTTPMSVLEDFTIDPYTRTARNINLHTSMKVVYKNEDDINSSFSKDKDKYASL